MRVVISGASGFIGKELCKALNAARYSITALTRDPHRAAKKLGGAIQWVPWDGRTAGDWANLVDGAAAVINLAGENIASRLRWNEHFKQVILRSRTDAAGAMAEAILAARRKPRVLLQASAVGYYGSRGDEALDEDSSAGEGFMPRVCREWESTVEPLQKAGVRAVIMRFGVVLGRGGGALRKMLPPFRMFVGGPPGDGRQWFSWIHQDDVVAAAMYLLQDEQAGGVYNLVAPGAVRMGEFCRHLGKALQRPSWLPVPAFLLRAVLGEMARETLLISQRVIPRRLLEAQYPFHYPDLPAALEALFHDKATVSAVS